MIKRFLFFLLFNFSALFIGSLLMRNPATNEWYQNLQKAPWTPPGWVFGFAWFTIMVLFALFMAKIWETTSSKKTVLLLYTIQWILNVSWNPVFFRFHFVFVGFVILIFLFISLLLFWKLVPFSLRMQRWFLLPYVVWMTIAISLNGYIWIVNADERFF